MAEEEIQNVGPWKKVKVLGRGGFGQVTLWHNVNTNEDIAIKKLRENELQGIIKNKQKERWCKEVEIMKKLNHLNVVKAVNIPQELNSLASTPTLAMEFCSLGDLRQVLNKPQHCCGLKGSTVIAVLKDISSALSYLHSCKIIHRDLKPDNVVLQQGDSRVIYKLIDLGYAKELDQNSLCESFVGTIQYLAPELFLGKSYTCSVDYWSFGVLAHEMITGYRPFLPGFNPPDWMKQIQNKPRNVISVNENLNGEVIHSTTISRVNHVSRCLLQDIEKWLQLALDWNGQTRGRDVETKALTIFDKLNVILTKKVIKVFSLPTYELLSYEIKADTDILSLRGCLQKDTGLEIDDQMLLLPSGKCVKSNGLVVNAFQNETIEADGVSLFLYSCGPMKIRSRTLFKPLYVKELLEEPKKPLPYKHLKRSCSDSVFYLQSEAELYMCLLQAIRVKIENIKHRTSAVETLYEDVSEEWNQVESFAQFLMYAHKIDLESYIQLRKAGELPSSGLVQKWIQKVTDVEKKLAELRNTSNKTQQKLSVTITKQNFQNLENNSLVQPTERTILNDLVDDGQKLWDRVQKIPRDVRGISMSNTDMAKVLYRCIEQSCKLFKNPSLDMLFLQISETEERLTKLVSPLTIWLKSTKIMKQIIENTQKERQREVWGLILKPKTKEVVKEKEKEKEKKDLENDKESMKDDVFEPVEFKEGSSTIKNKTKENEFSPFHIPKTVQNDVITSPTEEFITVKPNFKISEPVSIVPYKSDFSFNSSYVTPPDEISAFIQSVDANAIINDNNQLRYKTQDLTHSCHQMMKDIQSLNWDFLTDTV